MSIVFLVEAAAIRRNSLSGRSADPGAANTALRQLQKSSSVLVAIGWTDASGKVLAHSYDHSLPRSNISGMSHFIAQRDGTGDGLFIAPPYLSAAGDKWLTAASRRLSNADGSFAGIVTAPLDQSYFTKIYRSIDLGQSGIRSVVPPRGKDSRAAAREQEVLGKSLADGPLFTKYLPSRRRVPTKLRAPSTA